MSGSILSPYIIVIVLAWVIAHTIKYFVSSSRGEKYTLKSYIFMSGGMPSSHSATAISLATLIGLKSGFDSGLFSLALLFAMIVMYDALKVRRSSGEQGLAIHKIIKSQKINVELPRVAKGHTLIEVILGAILGFIVGLAVYITTL